MNNYVIRWQQLVVNEFIKQENNLKIQIFIPFPFSLLQNRGNIETCRRNNSFDTGDTTRLMLEKK